MSEDAKKVCSILRNETQVAFTSSSETVNEVLPMGLEKVLNCKQVRSILIAYIGRILTIESMESLMKMTHK